MYSNTKKVTLVGLLVAIVFGLGLGTRSDTNYSENFNTEPTVFIAILIRNKAHTLPYFLTLLEGLDYPKDRISLW